MFWGRVELELELIQTHMTQKPVLRVEAGARALRMLAKNMCGWTERASAGVQGTCVWAWISGAPVWAGWTCDGEDQLSFMVPPPRGVQGAADGSRKIKSGNSS